MACVTTGKVDDANGMGNLISENDAGGDRERATLLDEELLQLLPQDRGVLADLHRLGGQ